MRIRLGYVAIALNLEKVTSSSTLTYSRYLKLDENERLKKLKEVTYSNIEALEKILRYNIENNNILVYYIFTILYFLANFLIYILAIKYSSLSLNLEVVNNYNNNLKNINDTIRAFKHDFANIMASIGGFIATNDISGLKQYYSNF